MPPTKPASVNYDLALRVVEQRLAIEMATALLKMGRPEHALAAMELVQAPGRLSPADKATEAERPTAA